MGPPKEHRLRISAADKMPTTFLGVLRAAPRGSESDPFTAPRVWLDGVLPSFRSLGAIGKGTGTVIYSDGAYVLVRERYRSI